MLEKLVKNKFFPLRKLAEALIFFQITSFNVFTNMCFDGFTIQLKDSNLYYENNNAKIKGRCSSERGA
ncbi:hypothetical protein DFO77_10265 [Marinilabilia salmonicolor]|uniref:Uncharacterized protein n=1 Tax=Marinilabilia salmonicolor TaxID=989 RepID=A0A368VIS6_9BACT|nr:hypothetical protein DFO77_10265 [Marinilabilia salmonicolor]